jgi:DNA-binding CsgD family transcriptional regulator
VEVNRHLAALNGLSREAHFNRSICSVVPEVGPLLSQLVDRTLQTRLPITGLKFAARVPFISGPVRDWLGSFYPVHFGNSAVGVAHTVFEVTEYSRVDAALAALAITFAEPLTDNALTCREADVLSLIGRGKTTKEIAALLSISTQTVGNHRKQICRKLNLHSTAELAAYAASISALPRY